MLEVAILLVFMVATLAYCITPGRTYERLPLAVKFIGLLIYAMAFAWLVLTERNQ